MEQRLGSNLSMVRRTASTIPSATLDLKHAPACGGGLRWRRPELVFVAWPRPGRRRRHRLVGVETDDGHDAIARRPRQIELDRPVAVHFEHESRLIRP